MWFWLCDRCRMRLIVFVRLFRAMLLSHQWLAFSFTASPIHKSNPHIHTTSNHFQMIANTQIQFCYYATVQYSPERLIGKFILVSSSSPLSPIVSRGLLLLLLFIVYVCYQFPSRFDCVNCFASYHCDLLIAVRKYTNWWKNVLIVSVEVCFRRQSSDKSF